MGKSVFAAAGMTPSRIPITSQLRFVSDARDDRPRCAAAIWCSSRFLSRGGPMRVSSRWSHRIVGAATFTGVNVIVFLWIGGLLGAGGAAAAAQGSPPVVAVEEDWE